MTDIAPTPSQNSDPKPDPDPAQPLVENGFFNPDHTPSWFSKTLNLFFLLIVFLAVLALGLRLIVLTDWGRNQAVQWLEAQDFGGEQLEIKNFRGDVFSRFSVESLKIKDKSGTWFEAGHVKLSWEPLDLLIRRLHIRSFKSDKVTILRLADVSPSSAKTGTQFPIGFVIDELQTKLETLPKVSIVPGLWHVQAKGYIRRNGFARANIQAKSLLHRGDGLSAKIGFGEHKNLNIKVKIQELAGGAIAGLLGLSPQKALYAAIDADGLITSARLRILLRSGLETPLNLSASWGRDGATATAKVNLTLSTRTRFLVDKIGPEADFVLLGRKLGKDLDQIEAKLSGSLARAELHGPFNVKTGRLEDAKLLLTVAALSNWWVPVPKIGATHIVGNITGDLANFNYQAETVSEQLTQNGYIVPQLHGPMTFSHHQGLYELSGDFAGTQARGEGVLWTVLGPKPVVHIDGVRLSSGRFLFKKLIVSGSHLNLEAGGGFGLFGALDFQGHAKLSSLGLGPGAEGVLEGDWKANLPKSTKTWNWRLTAKGSGLTTGLEELDRLLGQNPRLSAEGSFDEGNLKLKTARFDGLAAKGEASGLLDPQGRMDFNFHWETSGPFVMGPLEISGQAHGLGKLSGSVLAPRADMSADVGFLDLGPLWKQPAKMALSLIKTDQGLDGTVTFSDPGTLATVTPGMDHVIKTGFQVKGKAFMLSDLELRNNGLNVFGLVSFQNGKIDQADLQGFVGPGPYLASGRVDAALKISQRTDGPEANLKLEGQDFRLANMIGDFQHVKLTGQGPLNALPFRLDIESASPVFWNFQGQGRLSNAAATGLHLTASLTGSGKINRAEFHMTDPAVFSLHDDALDMALKAGVSDGQASFTMHQNKAGLRLGVNLKHLDLKNLTEDYVGLIGGDFLLETTTTTTAAQTIKAQNVKIQGAIGLEQVRNRDAPENQALSSQITADLDDRILKIRGLASNRLGLKAHLNLDLPVILTPYPFHLVANGEAPLSGDFAVQGDVRPLWDFLIGSETSFSGKVQAKGQISGSIAHWRSIGQAQLTDGNFTDAESGLSVKGLNLGLSFDETKAVLTKLEGHDAQKGPTAGQLTGQGQIGLLPGSESDLKLIFSRFQIMDNDIGQADVSGTLDLARDRSGFIKLSGRLDVNHAELAAKPPVPSGVVPLEVTEIHQKAQAGRGLSSKNHTLPIGLDVWLKASRGLLIKGNGLDVELALDGHVTGNTLTPKVSGVAKLIRGSYEFSGKRFDFDELSRVELGATPETIRLDLIAQRQDTALTANINIKGTAAKPEITLTSVPVLPQDEILSRILFGESATQLSPFEAAQLASALTSLATGGGFDVFGELKQFTKLDRLAIGVDTDTVNLSGKQVPTLSGGKYLTDNVYVELTGGAKTGPSAQLELRLLRNLSIISQIGGQGDARLSIRFRHNY